MVILIAMFNNKELVNKYIIIQMNKQEQNPHQKTFNFNKIVISSDFESGNLLNVAMPSQTQINLWIGPDPNPNSIAGTNYKTWFYFSIQGIKAGTTITFTIMNMNNQVKLFKENLVPVYCHENNKVWERIKIPIAANGVVKGEEGFQIVFKFLFLGDSKYYFAFTYPWTNQDCQALIKELGENAKPKIFWKSQQLCRTSRGRSLTLLTLTRASNAELKIDVKKIGKNEIMAFENRKGIFISARVHPGETASSHIMNGILKCLFRNSQLGELALENCVFYIVPIVNPDGVAQGNFRTDCQGKNLNRYYNQPTMEGEPEIYYIKQFVVQMIKSKLIGFCLDLHAHVNKQGAFIYGNSTNSLYNQAKVCLFPKLLSFNNEIFDFESCNFSQKNMSSKDKGDQLSKEGASRVAIYKDTGLVQCWTLQCNYNSAKVVNVLLDSVFENKNSSISNVILCGRAQPQQKQQIKYLNLEDFDNLGLSIIQSICDFYSLKDHARIFSSKLKNMNNLMINIAIYCLRLLPFRFDGECRKLLDNINGGANNVRISIQKIQMLLNGRPNKLQQNSVPSSRQVKSTKDISSSQSKRQAETNSRKKVEGAKVSSLKKMQKGEIQKNNYQVLKNGPKMVKIPFPPIPKREQKKQKQDKKQGKKDILSKLIEQQNKFQSKF